MLKPCSFTTLSPFITPGGSIPLSVISPESNLKPLAPPKQPTHNQQITCPHFRSQITYLKVGGQWLYLYRAVDKQGKTVESYLSRTRDVTAAKAFFRKALKRHGEPRVITLDGFEPTHFAFRPMGMNNEFNYRWKVAVQIRTSPYLNNIVEQDHRRVKSRVGPMLGFKRFFNARRVVAGVELVQKIVKGQFDVPASFGPDPFCICDNMLAA